MRLGPVASGTDPIAPDYAVLMAILQAAQAATPTVRASRQVQLSCMQVSSGFERPSTPYFYDDPQCGSPGSFHKRALGKDSQQS